MWDKDGNKTRQPEQTIQGLDIALATMKEGELATITCAPRYAYGPTGNPHGFHGSGKGIPPNAVLEFELELLDIESEGPPAKTDEEKIKAAQRVKELGNDLLVKEQQPARAAMKYRRALNILFDMDEDQQARAIVLACHLNSAACYLRMGASREAIDSATKALALDPKNTKAYFRLAKGQMGLGYLEEAKEALEKALAIQDEPEIRKELRLVNQKLQASKKKQQKFYGNMLGKLAEQKDELYSAEELKKQAEEDKKAKIRKCNYCDAMIDDVQWARHMIKYHSNE